jgi:hypothetical protein
MLDIFRGDAFSTTSLTRYVERNPYLPVGLGELGLFVPTPVRTRTVAVEERDGQLTVIKTSELGAPPQERTGEKRKIRDLRTTRLALSDTLYATEVEGVRDFGEETALMQIQAEVARRLSGPTGLQNSLELTRERHRLGAIQGIVLDADGSTIYNYFTEFGIAESAELNFNLADRTAGFEGRLRKACNAVVRAMIRACKGSFTSRSRVVAICGDEFWDALTTHPDVEKTYLNWQAAQELRGGNAFGAMDFGGISWTNYRGTDDGTTVAVGTDKVRFVPQGAGDVFQEVMAPAEFAPWINTMGKKEYIIPIVDKDRNAWWKQEIYSYPLFLCSRPEVLMRGKLATGAWA